MSDSIKFDDQNHDLEMTGRKLKDLCDLNEDMSVWEERRKEIQHRILNVLGDFPVALEKLDVKYGESVDCDTYIRQEVYYRGEPEEWISAYLLYPKKKSKKLPAVICLHETQRLGKAASAIPGAVNREDGVYGYELVKRGYITLVPDHFTIPPRGPKGKEYNSLEFETKHPEWSPTGKKIWDVMRAVDFLSEHPEVDSEQIGCIGHSLGGFSTVFAAAFDQRIKLAVSSCGFSTFSSDRSVDEYVRKPGQYRHFPKLSNYIKNRNFPFDLHEVTALIAPRPLFLLSGYHDIWCRGNAIMGELTTRVHHVYDLYQKPDEFTHIHHGEGHSFSLLSREMAYLWIDSKFKAI